MQKKTFSSVGSVRVPETGNLIPSHTTDYLVGRLLTLVESLGLRESQESAVKSLVKQEVYNALISYESGSVHISPELNGTIREFIQWERKEANKAGLPSGQSGEYELTFIPK